jgi:3-oxoacyl-(acyl-carrier-protein) synthase
MNPGRPLAIIGLGCVGAPGIGLAAQRAALASGATFLATFATPGLPLAARLPVGRVAGFTCGAHGRTAALALLAAQEALTAAGLDARARHDLGLIVGTCTAGLTESEVRHFAVGDGENSGNIPGKSQPGNGDEVYRHQQAHRVTQFLAARLGLRGPQGTHSVACASAAAAVIEGAELVRAGICPAVVVVGADALCRVTMAGFTSLMLVDPAGCRPFTEHRAGMSLGEGAGALVIADPAWARARGALPVAAFLGWGSRADGHHPTTPDPSGAGLEAAVRDSLADAGVVPGNIGYVSAHGTGTRDNDQVEAAVLSRIFGTIPVASSKRTYGHSMGACAAVEAVGCCLALSDQRLWPSAGAEGDFGGVEVVRSVRAADLDVVASTTLAFGGVDACLVFARRERVA